MEKKILILVSALLFVVSCSNNHKLNNDYSNDENKIIYDFISSENPEKNKIFSVFVDRSSQNSTLFIISMGDKPMYPLYDFTVDSINGNIVIFQSEKPLKNVTFYEKYIKKGYVDINNMYDEGLFFKNYIIIFCPKSKKQKTYTREEYYNAINGNEVKFLENFCN